MTEEEIILECSVTSPRMQFFNISANKIYKQMMRGKKRGPLYTILRIDNPVNRNVLSLGENQTTIQFINMRMLESSGLFFGFLFEIPDICEINIKLDRMTIIKKRLVEYTNVELRYQDNFLNIFSAPQGAILMTTSAIKLFDPNIVREQRMSKGD